MPGIGQCCCTAPCDTPTVTISGYTEVESGLYTNTLGDVCDTCCWYGSFNIDAPGDVQTDTCWMICNVGLSRRHLVHQRITPGFRIEVWLNKTTCDCSPYSSGEKWILSSRVHDAVEYFYWLNAHESPFGGVPTCSYPCPPIESLTPTNCQWFKSQCPTQYAYWFRQKVYTTYPSGSITFTNSDLVACLLDTSPDLYKLPCTGETRQGVTADQTVTYNINSCTPCSGTNNQSVTFSAPSWTINIA